MGSTPGGGFKAGIRERSTPGGIDADMADGDEEKRDRKIETYEGRILHLPDKLRGQGNATRQNRPNKCADVNVYI